MSIKTHAFAAGLLLATQPLLCATAAGQSATGPTDSFPFCAWWAETTATSLNVAFPDTNAAYWTTPLQATQDLASVTVSGRYEDARYFSLNAYTNSGASYACGDANTPSALADYLIAPDSGSLNPFQASAAPGGRYTVTLARSGAGATPPNTIPLYQYPGCEPAPSQSTLPSTLSFLILRVYLPQDGFKAVVLPDLTLHYADGQSVTLPQCPGRTAPSAPSAASLLASAIDSAATVTANWTQILRQIPAANDATRKGGVLPPPCGSSGAAACPPDLTFFRPPESATGGLFPNQDTKYLAALVQPEPGRVIVIRARAASFPPGMQPMPWDPKVTELRYWSMCSNIYRRPYPVVVDTKDDQSIPGCAADVVTAQDGGGYTYVVSHLRDKPSEVALATNNATWLPFSNTQPYARHFMTLRNMLGADFPQSVQNCSAGSDPASIAACKASMADYYPEVAECRAQTFETGGTAACFQEHQLAQALQEGTMPTSGPGGAEQQRAPAIGRLN